MSAFDGIWCVVPIKCCIDWQVGGLHFAPLTCSDCVDSEQTGQFTFPSSRFFYTVHVYGSVRSRPQTHFLVLPFEYTAARYWVEVFPQLCNKTVELSSQRLLFESTHQT